MTTEDIEGWILDYACKFYKHEVIAALHNRHGEKVSTLGHLDVRLYAATLHRIVHCREYEDLKTAVELVQELYSLIKEHCPQRVYYRLVFPLKIKVLLIELQKTSKPGPILNLKLNEYIPRCGLVDTKIPNKDLERLQTYLSNFRKFYLSLLSNDSQRQAYLEEELEKDFGDEFMKSLEKHTARFLEQLEKCLPPTVIEKMMQKGIQTICDHVPSISAPLDILLECLLNKSHLDTKDLLDLLTLIHPISTQDRFQHKFHLTFGSDDSSNDSRLSDISNISHENLLGGHGTEKTSPQTLMPDSVDCGRKRTRSSSDLDMSLTPSGESVSVISKHRPGISHNQRECKVQRHEDQTLSQVYVVSSSSDSATTAESQRSPRSQGQGDAGKVFESGESRTSGSEPGSSDQCDSTKARRRSSRMSLGNSCEEDLSCDISNSFSLIPSSNVEEIQEFDLDSSRTAPNVKYPSISKHQKDSHVKLCVVKLYRDQSLDEKCYKANMELYR